jgi:putrescine transport system ATP-binding protein
MATRIGLLHQGRLEQVGTPAEIYERPTSRYVATFMGGANILEARVLQAGPDAVLDVPGIGVMHAQGTAEGAVDGAAVYVALRPERLRLGGGGVNQASGTVADVAYRGDVLEFGLRLADGTALTVLHPLSEGTAAGLPVRGDAATVGWPPEACVLLTG